MSIGRQEELNPRVRRIFVRIAKSFRKRIPLLVCLASVRTVPRLGDRSPHFRLLPSDLLVRAAQTLGWFVKYNKLINVLERYEAGEEEEDEEEEDEEEEDEEEEDDNDDEEEDADDNEEGED